MVVDEAFFKYCLIIFSLLSPIFSVSSTASYGRHRRPTTTGKTIPAPLAWFLFESPTLWLTFLLFPLGKYHSSTKAKIHISFYLIHYFHRVIIYPLVMLLINHKNPNPKSKSSGHNHVYPLKETALGIIYNLLNAYLQARSASEYTNYGEDDKWFRWRFVAGLAIYAAGMAINVSSDYALLRLKSDQTGGRMVNNGYKIPKGGMFELVSCPNYFGEIMEWFGWALVTCCWAPFLFFLNTCCLLISRALAHHKWYLDKFGEDYPKNRNAVIPFVC